MHFFGCVGWLPRLRQSRSICPLCTADMDELVRRVRSRARISLSSNGVDLKRFSTDVPVWPRVDAFRIVMVSRNLLSASNIDRVVAAFPRLGDVELSVAGGHVDGFDHDPELRRLRKLASSLGVSARVRLMGRVSRNEMPGLLRSADVVVTASNYEPASRSVLEAMACGIPVVAAVLPQTLDALVHNVTGRYIRPGDDEELVTALRALIHQPFERAALGLAGRARARSCFSWDAVARQRQAIYGRVLEATVPQPSTTLEPATAVESTAALENALAVGF